MIQTWTLFLTFRRSCILHKFQLKEEPWNASQLEKVKTGKIHGFMRMHWTKKILEWTNTPEDILNHVIYVNDRDELDGKEKIRMHMSVGHGL